VALAAVKAGKAQPLEQILRSIGTGLDGELIDARLVQAGSFLLYELKVLSDDGRTVRRDYYYATSGRPVRRD
jgi:hypothetical protein